MDLTKVLAKVADHAEVRKLARRLRKMGLADHLANMGLVPRARMWVLPTVGLFATGAVCGAIAALLLTPRTGEALRKDIGELLGQLRARAGAKRGDAHERVHRDAHASS